MSEGLKVEQFSFEFLKTIYYAEKCCEFVIFNSTVIFNRKCVTRG